MTQDRRSICCPVSAIYPAIVHTPYTDETYLLADGNIHPLTIKVSDPDGPRVIMRT